MPRLSVSQLHAHYGAHHALSDLNFDLELSEIIGIIGKNGAGKSTLVKVITGSHSPSSGQMLLNDVPLSRAHDHRAEMGYVPQSLALYPYLTARENLAVFGRLHGLTGQALARATEKALADVELTEHGDKLARHLSGGMQRRINVAAAILHRPDVLILDEPTAGTDNAARDVIYALIRRLKDDGMAILLISHDLQHCEYLCDKVLALVNGRQAGFDSPAALLQRQFGGQTLLRIRLSHFASETDCRLLINNMFIRQDGDIWHKLISDSETDKAKSENMARRLSTPPIEFAYIQPGLADLLDACDAKASDMRQSTAS